MTAVLDTNVIIRHLTQQPADQGQAASHFLGEAQGLVLTDMIVAETVHVLQSVYKASRETVVYALRALVAMRSVSIERSQVIKRCIDLFETAQMDFTDAYLVAYAESMGGVPVASFDRGIDKAVAKASPVKRLDPR